MPHLSREAVKFCVLGSGSSGNCAVISGPHGSLLIDAGLSARQITDRLRQAGVAPESLRGVLLTHEHGDHTRGLDVLLKGPLSGIPVLCNRHTRRVVRPGLREDKIWRLVETGARFEFAGWEIETFSVPHDAVDPMGFVLEDSSSGARLGVLSDLGHATANVIARLRDLDGLFLEANYCPELLATDTRRPWSTKQRISSRHGHLSNDQAAELLAAVACRRLRHVWLGHLSRDCNSPERALGRAMQALARLGLGEVNVLCASQGVPTPPVGLVSARPAPGLPARPSIPLQLSFSLADPAAAVRA